MMEIPGLKGTWSFLDEFSMASDWNDLAIMAARRWGIDAAVYVRSEAPLHDEWLVMLEGRRANQGFGETETFMVEEHDSFADAERRANELHLLVCDHIYNRKDRE